LQNPTVTFKDRRKDFKVVVLFAVCTFNGTSWVLEMLEQFDFCGAGEMLFLVDQYMWSVFWEIL